MELRFSEAVGSTLPDTDAPFILEVREIYISHSSAVQVFFISMISAAGKPVLSALPGTVSAGGGGDSILTRRIHILSQQHCHSL